MGDVIVEQIVSADGFAADADGGMSFLAGSDPSESDIDQLAMIERADALVFGRTTYEMFAEFWPGVTGEQEPAAEPMPKHVVSATLDAAPWGAHAAATVERGDGVAVVDRLRERYAGDLIVWGSLRLTDALFLAGRVDVLRLRIVPSLVGAGRPATPPGLPLTLLELTSSRVYSAGQVTVEYRVRH